MIAQEKALFHHDGRVYRYKDVVSALQTVGIRPGETIFVHSDLKSFGKLDPGISRNEYLEAFIQAFLEAVGGEGTLIMPTFSYTLTSKRIFDAESTPSTVGAMTEFFRKMNDVVRSNDPIFSIAAIGRDKQYFTEVGADCFGKDSIFEKLYERDASLVFIGETFDITFMHYAEQRRGVPYRFLKRFDGEIRAGGMNRPCSYLYNVRPLDQNIEYDLEGIASFFSSEGVLRQAPIGYSKVRKVGAKDAYDAIERGFRKNVYFLLKSFDKSKPGP